MYFSKPTNIEKFKTRKLNYQTRFINLLNEILNCYNFLIVQEQNIPSNENEIRDLLVDNYLSKKITNYTFKKEEYINLGRVDIFVVEKLTKERPQFVIECKILDNKNITGVTSKNAKYIKDGIYRFLTEYYYLDNELYTNAMIGFIVKTISIEDNIKALNELSKIMFKNLIDITQEIKPHIDDIYKSTYHSCTDKNFTVYHLMMDMTK